MTKFNSTLGITLLLVGSLLLGFAVAVATNASAYTNPALRVFPLRMKIAYQEPDSNVFVLPGFVCDNDITRQGYTTCYYATLR